MGKIPNSKSSTIRSTKEAIESSFSLIFMNIEALVEKGTFSFSTLNMRLVKATGDTLNNSIKDKIIQLKEEKRIGIMQFFQCTLMMIEKFAGKEISFNAVTVELLQKCERYWLKTRNISTTGMHLRNIRTMSKV